MAFLVLQVVSADLLHIVHGKRTSNASPVPVAALCLPKLKSYRRGYSGYSAKLVISSLQDHCARDSQKIRASG